MNLTPKEAERLSSNCYHVPDEVPNCPCCGRKAKLVALDGGEQPDAQTRFMIYCTCCHVQTMQYVSAEAAVRVWSTRPQ